MDNKIQVGEYAEITSGACRNIIGQVVRIDKGCVVLQVDAKTVVIASCEDVSQVSWAKGKR